MAGGIATGETMPPEKLRQMRELRERNLPIRLISRLTGVPKSTVGNILRGQGEVVYDLRCEQCEREMVALLATKRFCSQLCYQRWRHGRNNPAVYRTAA
jgi:hypothetical protein